MILSFTFRPNRSVFQVFEYLYALDPEDAVEPFPDYLADYEIDVSLRMPEVLDDVTLGTRVGRALFTRSLACGTFKFYESMLSGGLIEASALIWRTIR